jgi:hypothetical protein
VKVGTVAQTSSTTALLGFVSAGERTNFVCAGRFWQFFYDGAGAGLGWRTSKDGVNWSDTTYVSPTNVLIPSYWATYFDGTYIHYVATFSNNPVYYRRGLPNSNGTISWSATEQIVVSGLNYGMLSVCVDTNGYPYVAYLTLATGYGSVSKSSTNDGTWSTASAYPIQLSVRSQYRILLIQLTSGKIYVLYDDSNLSRIRGNTLINDVLGDVETISTVFIMTYAPLSAVAIGDDIHLVSAMSGAKLNYYKRTYVSGLWSTAVTLTTLPHNFKPCISVFAGNNLIVFYAKNDNCIYYIRNIKGSWESAPTKLVDETGEVIYSYLQVSASYTDYAGRSLLAWLGKSSSPYDVRFVQVKQV